MSARSGRSLFLPTSAELVKRNMINEAIGSGSGLCDFFCTCFVSVVAGAEARDELKFHISVNFLQQSLVTEYV